MTDTPPEVSRPPLAFRVGVTGSRKLDAAAIERLRPEIVKLLQWIAGEVSQLAADPRAATVYAPGAPALRLVSPLAEGADRLVAEEGIKAGFSLYAPLPFPQAEYEKDFPQTLDAFRALIDQAETLELDGARALEGDSYREVGRYVVRNCDLLIAIWDGERRHGEGGTAEIVQYAANERLPIWWIDASAAKPPRLIERAIQLKSPDTAPTGEAAQARLGNYLERAVLPPVVSRPEHGGAFGVVAHWVRGLSKKETSPLAAFLAEKPLNQRVQWRAFNGLMNMVAPKSDVAPLELLPPATRPEHWWDALYAAADRFSVEYGNRYRSSYVLIAGLAFVALAMAAMGTALPKDYELVIGSVELIALAGIALLVTLNHLYRWHERWISYRLLAELCRKQYVLSSIGRSLPVVEVTRASSDAMEAHEAGHGEAALPREAWVAWYFAAMLRAAPFVVGNLAAAKPYALDMARSLTAEQTGYHRSRRLRNRAASHAIGMFGEACFFLTVIAGGSKLASLFAEDQTLIAISATAGALLSAASGAFVGVRAYSEFSLLVRQSTHMLRVMEEAEEEFAAIDLGAPLASRDLGRRMYALAILMMNDVRGWAQLFGIKTLEAG